MDNINTTFKRFSPRFDPNIELFGPNLGDGKMSDRRKLPPVCMAILFLIRFVFILTEAWHVLGHAEVSRRALVEMCRAGVVKVVFDLNTELPKVLKLLEKYADTPMDFADACLVQMVESLDEARVWTVDSDFMIYRRSNRRVIKTFAPWD